MKPHTNPTHIPIHTAIFSLAVDPDTHANASRHISPPLFRGSKKKENISDLQSQRRNMQGADDIVNEAIAISKLHHSLKLDESDKQLKKNTGAPSQLALHAECAWIRAMITEEKSDAKVAFARIAAGMKTISKPANKSFWKNSDLAPVAKLEAWLWHRVHLADLYLLDSLLKFRNQKYIKGVLTFRKAWKSFDICFKHLPLILPKDEQGNPGEMSFLCEFLLSNINFGVGLFHFMVSVVPKQFLWLVEGIGFKADRKLALNELTIASNFVGTRTITAKLILIALHSFFFGDEISAMKVFKEAQKENKDSPAFAYFGGFLYRKQGKLAESLAFFEACKEGAADLPAFQNNTWYEIGYISFLQQDWGRAIELFKKFLENTNSHSYRAYCHYMVGICYAMLFEIKEAKKYMKPVSKLARKNYAYDEIALRRSKSIIQGDELSLFTRKFIIAEVALEQRDFDACVSALDGAESVASNLLEANAVLSLRGEVAKGRKHYDEALRHFNQVKAALYPTKSTKLDSWWGYYILPVAIIGIGEILVTDRKFDEAEENFKIAKKFSGFDFENWGMLRVRRGLETIADQRGEKRETETVEDAPATLEAAFDADDDEDDGTGVGDDDN